MAITQAETLINKQMSDIESKNQVKQENVSVENGDNAGRDIFKPTYYINTASTGGSSQLNLLYKRLESEMKDPQKKFEKIIEELHHYKSSADGDQLIGLEKKLENGDRSNYLEFAMKTKEKFTKKLLANEHFETAQEILVFLLAKVYCNFHTAVYSQLKKGHPEEYINALITAHIIKPLEDILGENLLKLYEDDINGMIYFLTGNCHIKWD